MMNSDDPKSQYVDISYGWKDREELVRLRSRRRRWRWMIAAGIIALCAVIYLLLRSG